MAKKSFTEKLDINQELKRESNLESENERLRDKIKRLEAQQNKDIFSYNIKRIK